LRSREHAAAEHGVGANFHKRASAVRQRGSERVAEQHGLDHILPPVVGIERLVGADCSAAHGRIERDGRGLDALVEAFEPFTHVWLERREERRVVGHLHAHGRAENVWPHIRDRLRDTCECLARPGEGDRVFGIVRRDDGDARLEVGLGLRGGDAECEHAASADHALLRDGARGEHERGIIEAERARSVRSGHLARAVADDGIRWWAQLAEQSKESNLRKARRMRE
jgi:hypothetical protein